MRAKNPPKNRSPYIKVVIDAIDFDRSKESPSESRIGIMVFEEKIVASSALLRQEVRRFTAVPIRVRRLVDTTGATTKL